ncbi:MAG: aminopeptidase, partial [Bacteroidales bacterium]|nr:aminopeptidase [Bacteroidales bacterium]
MIKKLGLVALFCFSISTLFAQEVIKENKTKEGFQFTTIKENPITPVKNQNRSSTCWSFSGLGLLESELLRLGKGEYDLSEMFVVHHTMVDRAVNYIRLHGESSFSPGGSFYDVIYCLKHYGLVPQEAMEGIMYGDTAHVHKELDAVAEGYVNAIAKGNHSKLTPVWKEGLISIYDTYLGACPEQFTFKGKEYTPHSFAEDLGLKAEDYISLTSYTH